MKNLLIFLVAISSLVAVPCSEGGCPAQMIENLRQEKQKQKPQKAPEKPQTTAQNDGPPTLPQIEEEESDGEEMDEANPYR